MLQTGLRVTVSTLLFVCLVYCPSDFKYHANQDTCLKLVNQTVDWPEANTGCHSENTRAHLVVIDDVHKQLHVKNLIQGEDKPSCLRLFLTLEQFVKDLVGQIRVNIILS